MRSRHEDRGRFKAIRIDMQKSIRPQLKNALGDVTEARIWATRDVPERFPSGNAFSMQAKRGKEWHLIFACRNREVMHDTILNPVTGYRRIRVQTSRCGKVTFHDIWSI
jgi:hypothetical protein